MKKSGITITEKITLFVQALGMVALIYTVIFQLSPPYLSTMLLGDQFQGVQLTFQLFMWLPFSLGLILCYRRTHAIANNRKEIETTASLQFENEDVTTDSLRDRVSQLRDESKGRTRVVPYLLAHAIDTILDSQRYSDVKTELESRANLLVADLESDFSKIKYLTWLLPTLGFMGTVYGISAAVGAFGAVSLDDANIIELLAGKLAVAFDTTLLSLIQSSILVLVLTMTESRELDVISEALVECQEKARRITKVLKSEKSTQGLAG